MCKWKSTSDIRFREFSLKLLFLGTFANLRKRLLASSCLPVCPSLSVCLSVRPSVPPLAWNSAPTRRVSKKIDYFSKIGREIKFSLKSEKKSGYFAWRPTHIFITSRSILLRIKNVADESRRGNQNIFYVQ